MLTFENLFHSLTLTKSCDVTCHETGITKCKYYKIVEVDHILFIVNRKKIGVQFDLIYDSIFEQCRKEDYAQEDSTH